jgi:hypothetical protein
MADQKPWEALGVSKSKYYRDKKAKAKRGGHKIVEGLKQAVRYAKIETARPLKVYRAKRGKPYSTMLKPMDEFKEIVWEGGIRPEEAKAAPRGADAAMVEEFLAVTAPEYCGPNKIYHRVSPGMVGALRRVLQPVGHACRPLPLSLQPGVPADE